MSYRVWCLTWEDDEEQGRTYPSKPPRDVDMLDVNRWAIDERDAVRIYAEYCHSERDGWESNWPLTFRVRLPDGTTRDFEVEREMVPEFVVGNPA